MRTKTTLERGAGTVLLVVMVLASAGALGQSDSGESQDRELSPAVPPGYRLVEGDILVRVPEGDLQPASTFNSFQLWPGGVVPYRFDSNVSAANQSLMIDAMRAWEDVADVDFRPRDGEADFVHIQASTLNNSEVGRIGGRQIINITSWNAKFRMVHELGHTLGFYHEQSRSDRNDYITINWDNIDSTNRHNFVISDEATEYGPYDFDSVMHYAACDFSTCSTCSSSAVDCRTIDVKPPYATEWQSNIGQRTHLSWLDILTMSFLYPESNWRFADQSYYGTQAGTFFMPARTIALGEDYVPEGGTLWIQPGEYSATGTHAKQMTLQAPLGGVTIR
jgi:hypothetical protein